MLDIRIVLRGVGDDMVDVVASLPPAHGQATDEVGNDNTNARVDLEIMRDTHMPSIMCRKNELVPHKSERKGRRFVPPKVYAGQHANEGAKVSNAFYTVGPVVALVQPFIPNPLM